MGNIHNLAYRYIPSENMYYMADSIFVAKSGYLKLLSELGMVGLVAFSAIFFQLHRRLSFGRLAIDASSNALIGSVKVLLLLLSIAYLGRGYLVGEVYLIVAIAAVLSNQLARQNI